MPVPVLLGDTAALRRHCEKRLERLIEARRPWLDFSRLVAQELLPSRLPYLADPHSDQRGGEQNTHIVDGVGHLALETSAAGITSGVMPTSSPWFELLVRDQFEDDEQLELFLEESARRLLTMHNQSNAGQTFPELQKEWLAFGTAATLLTEDEEDAFHLDPMSIGEYCIAEDRRQRVDTVYRQLTLTVSQLAQEFGAERLSPSSRVALEGGYYDTVVPCVHAIEPDRDGLNPEPNPELPWRSVYYEQAGSADQVLAVRGYKRFPALVWRWGKLPGQAYGYGRGHDALPHLVRLRKMIYRYGQAMAFKAEPPVQIPAGLAQHEVRMLPGGKTSVFGQQPITTLFRVELELKELAEEMERTRQDIRDTLGSTLVASLRSIRHQMTAREADLRTTQDLQEFLPGLSRLNEELLNPYVEWMWSVAEERGLLPPAPPSLQGQVIDIEFKSPLARKQRQGEVEAIVRTFAIAGEIAKVRQDIVDNLDVDQAIRKIAQIEGAPIDVLLPLDEVHRQRQARDQAQLAEAKAAAAQQGADIAQGLSQAQANIRQAS